MSELVLSEFTQKGEQVYRQRILPAISEEALKGKIVAIEVESGEYYIDDTAVKAATQAQRQFPDKEFYFKRIGYSAVHSHKGVVKRMTA